MTNRFLQVIRSKLRVYSNYFFIILIVFLMISLARNIVKTLDAQKKIDSKEKEISALEKKNEDLRKELSQVQSSQYTEAQLRDKLGLAKEGETVVVLPDKDILKSLVPERSQEENTLPDPNWKKWIKLFY
jgi:cell division protein FtsB